MKKIFSTVSIVALLVVLVLSFSLMACKTAATETTAAATETTAAATETTAAGAEQKKYNVGYQIYFEGNDWSLQMAEEFKYAITQEPYASMVENVYYVSDEFDVTKQMNNFDDLVTKGCDIIFLSPVDPKALVEKISQAEAQGIKVVLFGINMDGEDYTASVNVSDYTHGKSMAEFVAKAVNGKGKVAVMNGIAGTQTAIDIHNGIADVIKDYPDITLLPDVYTNWDYAVTKQATQDALQANPDLAGIISHSEPRACAEVFIESGKPFIPMNWMGSNGSLRVWKENLDKGIKLEAQTKPPYISKIALEIGFKALQGETIEKFTEVPVDIITEAEIDDYYRPDLSDRYWVGSFLPDDVIQKLFPKE